MLAIGFRIKSGYAIAIVLAGSAKSPTVVARRIVELSDPAVAETKQPYHDGFGTEHEDPREIARRVKIIERCTKQAVARLIGEVRSATPSDGVRGAKALAGRSSLRAGLVVGSVIDPQKVGSPHIRAHANEGKLFRTVVEDALRLHGIACDVIVEKQLADRAASGLRRSDGEIKKTLAAFGKTIGGPWRAEEKAAAIAAWLALESTLAPAAAS
jgi:hypothetical protein